MLIVGGGSGHGFKHGPAVGEYVARLVAADAPVHERFGLAVKTTTPQRAVYRHVFGSAPGYGCPGGASVHRADADAARRCW